MGEARLRDRPKSVSVRQLTLLVDRELFNAIEEAQGLVNTERAKQGKPVLALTDFVVYGLLRAGLSQFWGAYRGEEAQHRLVKLPHEVVGAGR